MHGLIYCELEKFVRARLGEKAWGDLLVAAGLEDRTYMVFNEYPDAEIGRLVTTASTITGLSAPAILEDFGEFIVPDLLGIYGSLVKPEWRTLDFLEQTEDTIHRVVRFRNPGAMPPELAVKRTGDHEVVILYTSQRKMCSVAKGIIRGVAKHYGDPIEIDESHCMLKGHPQCTIEVRTL